MGNCSGLFTNCTGDADTSQNAVRRIDADRMAQALKANEMANVNGQQLASGNPPPSGSACANPDENSYNKASFGGNDGSTP